MRILLIPPNDWLRHPLTSRLHYIFERLAENHEVHILNFRISRFHNGDLRVTKAKLHNATFFHVNDLTAYYAINAAYHEKIIREIINKYKIDVLVTSNILATYFACKAAKRYGIPIVYDYLDHFPDSAALYYKNLLIRGLVKNIVSAIVKSNLQNVNKVVVPSKTLQNILVTKFGVKTEKISLIPNGVDISRFLPRDKYDALKKIGRVDLINSLIILFMGSIEPRFDLDSPIIAISRFSNMKLLIVGPELSSYHKQLKRKYANVSNIEFVGYVDSELVPYYINAADVCLAPYKLMKMNFSITLKILEYLASGKIVLVTEIPDVKEAFGKNVITYQGIEGIRGRLVELQNHPLSIKNSINIPPEVFKYSWDSIAESYETFLKKLTGA